MFKWQASHHKDATASHALPIRCSPEGRQLARSKSRPKGRGRPAHRHRDLSTRLPYLPSCLCRPQHDGCQKGKHSMEPLSSSGYAGFRFQPGCHRIATGPLVVWSFICIARTVHRSEAGLSSALSFNREAESSHCGLSTSGVLLWGGNASEEPLSDTAELRGIRLGSTVDNNSNSQAIGNSHKLCDVYITLT